MTRAEGDRVSWSPNQARWDATAPWRRYAARLLAFQRGLVIRPSTFVPDGEIWTFDPTKLKVGRG